MQFAWLDGTRSAGARWGSHAHRAAPLHPTASHYFPFVPYNAYHQTFILHPAVGM